MVTFIYISCLFVILRYLLLRMLRTIFNGVSICFTTGSFKNGHQKRNDCFNFGFSYFMITHVHTHSTQWRSILFTLKYYKDKTRHKEKTIERNLSDDFTKLLNKNLYDQNWNTTGLLEADFFVAAEKSNSNLQVLCFNENVNKIEYVPPLNLLVVGVHER